MTTRAHDELTDVGHGTDGRVPTALMPKASTRRWLLLAIVVAVIAAGLVISGVLSPSTVLYAGLFGGMLLMHLRGHGGHGGSGGHASHSVNGDDRLVDGPNPNETRVQDVRGEHGCH